MLLVPLVSTADLQGAARLATDSVVGVTDLVEAVHATVQRPLGRRERAHGIAGLVYRIVRAVARRVGRGADRAISGLDAVLPALPPPGSPARDAVVAALNGVWGQELAARGNPLATPLQVRYEGRPLDLSPVALALDLRAPSPTLLVQIHGICMHDGQWGDADHDPGGVLAEALHATRVALRYNSGRHISETGRDVAGCLNALISGWPVAVRRIVIVGHSMGGLVARSAFQHATDAGFAWPERDASLVMLGSPHHGAPLERIGSAVDTLLRSTRYGAPFARIGQIRSAGVTDLRYGSVRDEDWWGLDRFGQSPDARRPLPLPDGVACYVVAATTGDGRGGLRDQTVGDGLVPLDSALGRHPNPRRSLGVPTDHQWIGVGMTHFDLLHRPEVTTQLIRWLVPTSTR